MTCVRLLCAGVVGLAWGRRSSATRRVQTCKPTKTRSNISPSPFPVDRRVFLRGHHADITLPHCVTARQAVCIGWSQVHRCPLFCHSSDSHHLPVADRMRHHASPGLSRGHAQALPGGDKMKPVRRSRFKEPSSWGSLGAMIIGIALMPPANDMLMMLGIAFCALGIALRERHE